MADAIVGKTISLYFLCCSWQLEDNTDATLKEWPNLEQKHWISWLGTLQPDDNLVLIPAQWQFDCSHRCRKSCHRAVGIFLLSHSVNHFGGKMAECHMIGVKVAFFKPSFHFTSCLKDIFFCNIILDTSTVLNTPDVLLTTSDCITNTFLL